MHTLVAALCFSEQSDQPTCAQFLHHQPVEESTTRNTDRLRYEADTNHHEYASNTHVAAIRRVVGLGSVQENVLPCHGLLAHSVPERPLLQQRSKTHPVLFCKEYPARPELILRWQVRP